MLDPARLVFIDETAVSTNMVRLRGRAPRGVRVIGAVPLGRWETITFVAALRHNKMVAPMVVEGAMTGEMFLAYVENCLVPTLLLLLGLAHVEVSHIKHLVDAGGLASGISRPSDFAVLRLITKRAEREDFQVSGSHV